MTKDVFSIGGDEGKVNPAFENEKSDPTFQITSTEDQKEADREKNAAARGSWGGQIEFFLTMVGYAVGIGNVWRFPYLCYKNGGGAFLIPYVLMLALVGMPIFYFELAFGQFSSLGPIRIWNVSPICKGIGFGMVAISLLIALSYNVVIMWSIFYLGNSFTTNFPWSSCENEWNDYRCTNTSTYAWINEGNTTQRELRMNETLTSRNMTEAKFLETPSEQFFYSGALKMSSPKLAGSKYADGGINDFGMPDPMLLASLAIVWTLVFLVLIKGINSLGKIVYVVATFPYIIITVMLVFSCTLEGAGKGIEFYLTPNITKLQEIQVWSDAATQIFYSLSTCSGGMIAMASYNNFKNNIYRDAIIVPLINCATSVYAGFAVFAVLGYIAQVKNVDVSDVADAGPGLVFVVYPEALENMPIPTLWTVLFFLMMILLGFSSLFSIVETIFTSIMDIIPALRAKWWRPILLRGVCIAIFFAVVVPDTCPGGFYLFTLVDDATGGYPLLIMGFVELIAINFVYGSTRFADDIELMLGRRPNIYYRACWLVITPVLLLIIIVYSIVDNYFISDKPALYVDAYVFPDWCQAVYWMIVAFTVIWIPIMAAVYIYKRGGVRAAAAPSKGWGPALAEHRTGIYKRESHQMEELTATKSQAAAFSRSISKEAYYDNKGMHVRDEGYVEGRSLENLSECPSSLSSAEAGTTDYTIQEMQRVSPAYDEESVVVFQHGDNLDFEEGSTRF